MPSRILVLAKAFPPELGGVETYSEQVALAYARSGLRTHVITQFKGARGWRKRGPLAVYNVGPGRQWQVFARVVCLLWQLRGRRIFAGAHATTWRMAVPLTLLFKGPRFLTVHGREVLMSTDVLLWLCQRVTRHMQRVLVISETARTACARVAPALNLADTVVSWNGLTYPAQPAVPVQARDRLELLTACRLIQRKNVRVILDAMAQLKAKGDPVPNLTVAGTGPDLTALQERTRTLGLDPYIRFLGQVPRREMPELYRGCDVFIHPHSQAHDWRDIESFCLVIADAMGFGLPVIAGRDGAPTEYITHGDNGLLVDGADPAAVAMMIRKLQDPELRADMGRRAQAFATAHFSWDRHVQPLLERLAP